MSKNVFTPDFYKKVYNAICDYCKKNYESNGEASDTMSGCFTLDEYEAVFHEAEHKGHKTGDKVNIFTDGRWSKDSYELAFYDSRTDMYAVKLEKPVAGCYYRGVMAVRDAA